MPTNKVIYLGILIVAASALLWAGYQITNIALLILPWSGGLGALIIVIGLVMELRKNKALKDQERSGVENLGQTDL